MTSRKILVAMSGGVDSSVAAALLKEAGHEVAGATIRTWSPNDCVDRNTRACCGLTGVEDAREVADRLGIRYWVFNFEKEFKKHVIDYFASEYLKGRTPNPCIACNEHIKFRLFLHRARQLGFDAIATGHYAGLQHDPATDSVMLTEGRDRSKDQSYVLFPLDRDLLSHLYLPIGGFTKAEIRAKAQELDLPVWNKADSQEICFIPSNDYGAFLKREYPEEFPVEKGVIRDKDGAELGEHEGYYHYTRGQRRGLGIAHTERRYVVETNREKNEVVLGKKEDILNRNCTVSRVNWFVKPAAESFRAHVKIRSQHTKAPATVKISSPSPSPLPQGGEGKGEGRVEVSFDSPQDAITPGQAAVFYDGPRVLGGGWIDSV